MAPPQTGETVGPLGGVRDLRVRDDSDAVRGDVEPVPESEAVFKELAAWGDDRLRQTVLSMGRRAKAIVPECVALSVAFVENGLAFTLVASDEIAADLDAVQYLDGGPCVAATEDAERIDLDVEVLLDEGRWQMYAEASAAVGIASSLSMPILVADEVVGGVNLYASTPRAFDGHHEEVAEALGTSAEAAVTNADLSFSTRRRAAETPRRHAEQRDVDIALGAIAERHQIDMATARERLVRAAQQAGISLVQAARALRHLYDDAN